MILITIRGTAMNVAKKRNSPRRRGWNKRARMRIRMRIRQGTRKEKSKGKALIANNATPFFVLLTSNPHLLSSKSNIQ